MLQAKSLSYEFLSNSDNWTFKFLDIISKQSNSSNKDQSIIKENTVPYITNKETIKLTDIVEINPDKVSKDIIDSDEDFGYIDVSSITSETGLINKIKTIKGKDLPARARLKVREGDILLPTVRPGNNILALVSNKYDGCIVNSTLAVLRPKNDVTSETLYFLLRSELVQQLLILKAHGTTIPTISIKDLKTLELPISISVVKQAQETAKHLYKDWVENNTSRKSLQNLIEDTFIKYNVVSDKLNSQTEKSIFKTYPYDQLQNRLDVGFYFDQMNDNISLFTNEVKLKDVIKLIKSGATGVSSDRYSEHGIPFIRIKDLDNENIYIQNDNVLYVNEEFSDKYFKNTVSMNDILISKVGTVGKSALVQSNMEGAIINQHFSAIEVNDRILPEFLICYLKTSWAKNEFERRSGGAAQQFIKVDGIEAIPVPLPPINIQKEISDYVKHQTSDNRFEKLKADIDDFTKSITS